MKVEEIGDGIARLERRQRRERWANAATGALLVVVGLAYNRSQWLQDFLDGGQGLLLASFGGALLGAATRNWSGSRELGLARAALAVAERGKSV